jgi:hypothetical protein
MKESVREREREGEREIAAMSGIRHGHVVFLMHAWQMRREGQALTQRNTNLTANV